MTDALRSQRALQALVGAGVLALALGLALGALAIPSEAGYGGVGPNFLPWVVAIGLAICGGLIVREALTGGFRNMGDGEGAEPGADSAGAGPWWPGLVWVSAGLLANAGLITRIGFVFSCALCYLLAVQGLRRAAGQDAMRPATLAIDVVTGLAIAAPVYWMFTRFLAIQLPGLVEGGWL